MADQDPFDIQDAAPDTALADKVRAACEEAAKLKASIEAREAAIKADKARLNRLVQSTIPSAMAAARVGDTLSLDDGHVVKLSTYVSGTLSKDPAERRAQLAEITRLGGSALIKTKVEVAFDKGEREAAARVIRAIKEEGRDMTIDMGIHPSTLKAWLKERMKKGEETPLDALGMHAGQVAKITPPKADDVIE